MRWLIGWLCWPAVALTMAGCASLSGSAKPVAAIDARIATAARYPEDQVLRGFAQPQDECADGKAWPACRDKLTRVDFRNLVAGVYMDAAEARYREFRDKISVESKGSALGGDLLVIVMNSVAVVSGNEARRALAAGSAAVLGSQSSISKDLFVQQALSAVLASMDSNRLEAEASIETKLRLDATQYSLSDAIIDIRGLEGKARLDEAIAKLTTIATIDAAQKKAKLDVAYAVRLQGPLVNRKSAFLDDIEALDDTKLAAAAEALGATKGADRQTQIGLLRVWVDQNVQSEVAFETAVGKLKSLTGKASYP